MPVGTLVPKEDLEDDAPVPPEVTKPPVEDAEALVEDAEEPDLGPMDEENSGLESDEAVNRYRMPDTRNRELFAIADQLMGASKLRVMCEDGKSRMARIPGKMKRRMWIKPGDLVIVKPWDFQDDKADVKYRYVRTQAVNLSRRKKIPELLDVGF
jgi:translation initiation factor 1A